MQLHQVLLRVSAFVVEIIAYAVSISVDEGNYWFRDEQI